MSSKLFKDFEAEFDRRRDEQRHGKTQERAPGEKRSWREIDRMRDGVGAGPPAGEKANKAQNRYAEKQAEKALLGQLDALFQDKEGEKLSQAVLDAPDRGSLQAAVDELLEAKGGLPPDPGLLEKALDVRRDKSLIAVIASIGAHLEDLSPEDQKVLLMKMRSKARTSFDPKVGKAVKALLAAAGMDGE